VADRSLTMPDMAVQVGHVGRRRSQDGATLVEFALVFPVFLLLVVGILLYSVAFATQQIVLYAADQAVQSSSSIDPGLGEGEYEVVALRRARSRITSVLGFLPGQAPTITLSDDCGMRAAQEGEDEISALCVTSDPADGNRRIVAIRLESSFGSLWPGFPIPEFLPGLDRISATSSILVGSAARETSLAS